MRFKFKALILCAGLGTRLRPITQNLPKCLVEIGEKPLLKYWLDHLASIGCEAALINNLLFISSLSIPNVIFAPIVLSVKKIFWGT